eukprot:175231-Hanusia_phi.AAC.1
MEREIGRGELLKESEKERSGDRKGQDSRTETRELAMKHVQEKNSCPILGANILSSPPTHDGQMVQLPKAPDIHEGWEEKHRLSLR